MTLRPVVRRAAIYNILPQSPDWFTSRKHMNAKWRFLRKVRSQYRMETLTACPWCGGGDFTLLATQERSGLPTSVVICKKCALVFTNPRLDSEALDDHYAQDYREIERGDIPDIHQFMFDLQKSKASGISDFMAEAGVPLTNGARITDIGCGEGGLLAGLAEGKGLQVTGYELNRAAVAYGRARGMDIRAAYFDGSGEPFDYVLLEQTLEHLPNPGDLLASIAKNQKPGGVLFIGIPGILAYPVNYENNFLQYLQYGHLFHYTLHTLERLVVPFGYRLALGNENIRAVFVRTSESTPVLTTPAQTADEIIGILRTSEEKFRNAGSQLLRSWKSYVRYSLRWALCAVYPVKKSL